jgi:hypothetical protein
MWNGTRAVVRADVVGADASFSFPARRAQLALKLAGILIVFVALHCPAIADVSFSDSTFDDLDRELTTVAGRFYDTGQFVLDSNSGYRSANQDTAAGAGSYRRVTLGVIQGAFNYYSAVFGFSSYNNAVYNPTLEGPILSVDYREQSATFEIVPYPLGCNCQGTGPALRQNGVIYVGPGFATPGAPSGWEARQSLGMTASQFCAITELHSGCSQRMRPDLCGKGLGVASC